MTPEEKAREIVQAWKYRMDSDESLAELILAELIAAALHPAPPSEEEMDKMQYQYEQFIRDLHRGNPIDPNRFRWINADFKSGIRWALKRNRGE
jgi:hypothetical protein